MSGYKNSITDINGKIGIGVSSPNTALDVSGVITAIGGDSDEWNLAYDYRVVGHLPLSGGNMSGNINWGATNQGLTWTMNTDGAYIKFYNTGDGDTDSRLEYGTSDNGNEYHRFMISGTERMKITAAGITATGYNKTNWDTAYGWGDHSDNLYLPIGGKAADSELLDGIDSSRVIYGDNSTGTSFVSGATLDTALKSGFYTTDGGVPNATSVNFVLHNAYHGVGNLAGFDLACNDTTTSSFYLRPATGGGKGAWQTIITSANISSQSVNYAAGAGNASTLDTLDSSQFLRSDESDTMSGNLTVTGTSYFSQGLAIENTTGVLFAGLGDNNWKVYRSAAPGFTRSLVTNASININAHYGTGEGFAIGGNGVLSYYEILGHIDTPTHFFRGNVGIGTTSPAVRLHIKGAAATGSVLRLEPTTSTTIYSQVVGINGDLVLQADPLSNENSTAIKFEVDGTERMRIDFSGNVIKKVASSANGGYATNDGTNDLIAIGTGGYAVNGGSATDGGIRVTNNLVFATGSGSPERMRITSGGNVGIGTTSPSAKLQVDKSSQNIGGATPNGGILVSSLTAGNAALEIGVDPTSLSYIQSRNITNTTPYQLLLNPNGGNVGIGTTSPGYKLDVNGVTRFQNIVRFATNDWNLSDDGFNRFYFAGSGRTYFGSGNGYEWRNDAYSAIAVITNSGDLGIGTTNPSYKLDVAGDGRFNGNVALTTDASSGNYSVIQHNYNGVAKAFSGYNSGFAIYGGEAGIPTYIQAGGQYAMALLANGNVGIGTTSPGYKLDVNGVTRFQNIVRFATNVWNLSDDGFNRFNFSPSGRTYFGSGNGYEWRNDAYSAIAVITNSGDLGIGTTSPGGKLTVVGTISQNASLQSVNTWANLILDSSASANSDTNFVYARAGSMVWDLYNDGNDAFSINTKAVGGAGIVARFKQNGHVGIGDTDPDTRLSVYQSGDVWHAKIGNDSGQLRIGGENGSGAVIQSRTQANVARDLYLQRDGGNVGIGTTSPGDVLHVVKDQTTDTSITVSNNGSVTSTTSMSFTLGPSAVTPQSWFRAYRDGSASTEIGFAQSLLFSGVIQATKATRMVIDPDGDVGINVTNPTQKLHVDGNIITNNLHLQLNGNIQKIGSGSTLKVLNSNAITEMFVNGSGNLGIGIQNNTALAKVHVGGDFGSIYTNDASTGPLLVHNTSTNTSSYGIKVKLDAGTFGAAMAFWQGSTLRGYIGISSGGTTYSTSSDYRLKENVVALEKASETLMQLRPKRFNFIGGDGTLVDGFLAHEVKEYVPGAVQGNKDAIDTKGNPVYQGIDHSKLVPLLTAALQEALLRIEALEQQINNS